MRWLLIFIVMRIVFVNILLILSLTSKAQVNLVPNPSFEQYDTCPNGGQFNYLIDWQNPTAWGSPDFYNVCSQLTSIPFCDPFGTCYQNSKTGNAYVGLYTSGIAVQNGREYIQAELNSPLISGQCYYVQFYINLANWAKYGTNNTALNFSVIAPTLTNSVPLLNIPAHVKAYGNPIITDTLNWTFIQGIYTASGNESYITIGNFNNDPSTDTIRFDTTIILNDAAYYFIDDVSVIPIESIPGGMPAEAGEDQIINSGDSVFIGQQISNLNCTWFNAAGNLIATNTSGIYVKPLQSTFYIVEQNLCGTITYDTVYVRVGDFISTTLTIYPNPGSNQLNLGFNQTVLDNFQLDIVDIAGRLVYDERIRIAGTQFSIPLVLADGTYLVRLTNPNTREQWIERWVVSE